MSKVIVGIGIPGSGKTTFLKSFAEKHQYVYVCPDDIRVELTGDAKDQTKNKEVWECAHQRVFDAMKEHTVVVDATFVNADQRKMFLSLLRRNGAEKVEGILVDTPIEIAKERNQKRERVVPEHVLERMSYFLKKDMPCIKDGFDTLLTIDENKEFKKNLE